MVAKILSSDVIKALKKTYSDSKWFFMEQVKNGRTYDTTDMVIMDGVAILKSWVKFKIVGFEVKVSRGDFLGDQKRPAYLNYVHEFYFVVPDGLVKKEEVSEGVGLMYVMEDGSTKVIKRCKYMPKEIPADFLKYVIFSKLIDPPKPYKQEVDKFFLKQWIEEKKDDDILGWKVGSKMAKRLEDYHRQLKNMKEDMARYEGILGTLDQFLEKRAKLGYGSHPYSGYKSSRNKEDDYRHYFEKITACLTSKGLSNSSIRDIKILLDNAKKLENLLPKEQDGEGTSDI